MTAANSLLRDDALPAKWLATGFCCSILVTTDYGKCSIFAAIGQIARLGRWMKVLRTVLIAGMIAAPSCILCYCYFQLGREGKPLGFNLVGTDIALMLFAPIIVGIATAGIAPVQGKPARIISGVAALLATLMLHFVFPSPAIIYTHGFESAIKTDVGLEKLQQWADEALARFHEGTLSSTNASSYWSAGDGALPKRDLPPFLVNGLFAPSGYPNYGPEVSIRTNSGRWAGQSTGDCIALCWYDHGLLVGSPHFTCSWNPYYCQKLKPGIYSYYAPE